MAERNTEHAYYHALLQAIPGERPCGESLEYDAGFIMLLSKLQPKLDAEYGSFVEAAEPVNWAEIERDCQALLQRSRDIRLVVALMRCRIRQIGVAAINEGLLALRQLLAAFPQDLYPQLTEEGEVDPVMRANALAELEDINGLLADFRSQLLPKAAGLHIAVKDFEKAHATPREEGALPEATVAALKIEWEARGDPAILSLQNAWVSLTELRTSLQASLGEETPDFARLSRLLRLFVDDNSLPEARQPVQAEPLTEAVSKPQPEQEAAGEPVSEARPAPKEITGRAEALLKLQELRLWFSRMEPGSPAILLLRFAEQTVGKSYSQLLKMLPPEVIEKLAIDKE